MSTSGKNVAKGVAKDIRAVVFDAVGVLFSATVLFDPEKGEVLRHRSHVDGQGISLLRAAGYKIAFVSAAQDNFLPKLAERQNGLPSVKEGRWEPIDFYTGITGQEKVAAVSAWLLKNNVSWSACAYMGDDLGDLEVMKKVGLAACPAGAEKIIKDISHFTAEREGGEGAVRDFANFLLQSCAIDPTGLALR